MGFHTLMPVIGWEREVGRCKCKLLALFCPCSSAVPEDSPLYRPLEAKVHPRPEEGYAETIKGIPGDLGKAPTSAHYTDHNCLILKEK